MEETIKQLKRNIMPFNDKSTLNLSYGQTDIQNIIPHRAPFLFLDKLNRVNKNDFMIEGERYIAADDGIFVGHFPANPVYPGVLQIEIMGQLGLCLLYFIRHNVTRINPTLMPVSGLFTKVHHVSFIAPVYPNDTLQIIVKLIAYDEYIGTIAGQVVKDGKICSLGILEVYFEE